MTSQRLATIAEALDAAFEGLVDLHRQVCRLVGTRAEREWTGPEFNAYLTLSHDERLAERRYRVLRMRFDDLWRRENRARAKAAVEGETHTEEGPS